MTEGKPFPIIFAYFIPVLCSTLFQQLYSIVDTIIVGKGINDMAVAAVGASGSITFFIFGFIMGLGSGMAVLMAQAFGSGNYDLLRKTITMGFVSCGMVGIIVILLLVSRFGFAAIALAETAAWFGAFALNGVALLIKLRKLQKA